MFAAAAGVLAVVVVDIEDEADSEVGKGEAEVGGEPGAAAGVEVGIGAERQGQRLEVDAGGQLNFVFDLESVVEVLGTSKDGPEKGGAVGESLESF